MLHPRSWIGFGLVLSYGLPVHGQELVEIGRVKAVSGAAFLIRDGEARPTHVGEAIFEVDGLRTAADGRIGITLKDDTRLGLGPDSELSLDHYAYAPAEGHLAVALRILRGVVAYVSGQIAKLSPDSIRLETPAAIVGVRGTTLAFRVEPQ